MSKRELDLDEIALLESFIQDPYGPLYHVEFDPDRFKRLELDELLAYVLSEGKQAGVVPPDVELDQARCLFDVLKSNVQALIDYVPHPYSGPITLFRASNSFDGFDEDLGWKALAAGSLTVQMVPGNHNTVVLEPNAQVLAEQFRHHLRIAEREVSGECCQ